MARTICTRNVAFASVMIFFVCIRGKAEGRADKQAKKTTMIDSSEPTSSMIPSDMPSLVPSRRPSSSSQPSTIFDSFFETDMDDEPDDGEDGHQFVVRPFVPNENNIRIVGTVATMAEARHVEIDLPPPTQPGDLLVMFLHRTDDYLPFLLGGSWERVAWCFKGNNHYNCATECIQLLDAVGNNGERYCEKFLHPGRRGEPPTEADKHNPISAQDLSQVVFVREYTQQDMADPESRSIEVDFFGSSRHPSWIVLVVLRGASTIHPIRDWSATGADLSNHSVFPHVEGEPNDIIFLSQSFDDRVGCQNILGEKFSLDAASLSGQSSQGSTSGNTQCQGSFLNPNGTQLVGYVAMEGMDATAFLWGGTLLQHVDNSNPPIWRTEGPGKGGNPWGPPVKDLMISMTIRP